VIRAVAAGRLSAAELADVDRAVALVFGLL